MEKNDRINKSGIILIGLRVIQVDCNFKIEVKYKLSSHDTIIY